MDGAFYAIRGYAYQFDKTLLELLKAVDENTLVGVEQIQDISSDSYVIQVKYKETQEYSDLKLREPVLQLIEEYKLNPNKDYYLYCHFKDITPATKKLTLANLEKILQPIDGKTQKSKSINKRILNVTEAEKKGFIKKFQLIFSSDFQTQFEEVLQLLQAEYTSAREEELIFYYSQIIHVLTRLVIDNPNFSDRHCTKSTLLLRIRDARSLVFTSAFLEYKGMEEYLQFIKSKFIKPKTNRHNFILIGDIKTDSGVSVGELVVSIVEAYFINSKADIKPPVFIISDKYLEEVKLYLIERQIFFNDGYESIKLCADMFSSAPIINKVVKGKKASDTLSTISFKLRILGEQNISVIETTPLVPNMIYSFESNITKQYKDIPYLKADGLNTKHIMSLFT